MIKTRSGSELYVVQFPEGHPASKNRKHIEYAIKQSFDSDSAMWHVHRWEPDNWIEVGRYNTQEEADQAAQVVYDMRLFSR